MRRNHLFSILLLIVLILPLVSHFNMGQNNSTINSVPLDSYETPSSLSSNSPGLIQSEPIQPQVNPAHTSTPEPAPPEIPDNHVGAGYDRAAALYWNKTQPFADRDNSSDIITILEEGSLYREILNLTRIEAFGMTVVIEDDSPVFYVDLSANTPLFIGFHIMETVRLDGFWVQLYDKSQGWFEYGVYRSQAGVLPPTPDLIAPMVVPTKQVYVDAVSGSKWVWFDIDDSFSILDPSMTFADTFFLGFWKIAANWNLCPLGLYDSTDGEDESDVYYGWSLIYWTDDYLVNFDIIPIDPFFDPSVIGMTVNGTPVQDTGIPGTGWWQNILSVPINAPYTKRYYDVSVSWLTFYQWPVTFDGVWIGSYYNATYASSQFQVWTSPTNAVWTLNMSANFPLGGFNHLIRISIEEDWEVKEVRVANAEHLPGTIHNDWIDFGTYVQINSARNGFWRIQCDAPNYIIQTEVCNTSGQIITIANSSEEVTVRGYVQDPFGQNATNGIGHLIIYDPEYYFVHYDWNPLAMPPGGLAEINWSIWFSATLGGTYVLQILWLNGTEAGLSETYLDVYVPTFLDVTYEHPAEGEPVIRGDWVQIEVFYFTQYGYVIDDAIITVINDTSGEEWGIGPGDSQVDYDWYNWAEEGYPGYYTAILLTDNASPYVLHNITLYISSPCHQVQNTTKQFMVLTRATKISFFWKDNPLPGLNNISDYWFTDPHPYINDTTLQFTIRYTDAFGIPLTGAQLAPYIVHQTFGVYTRLDWVDLSIADSTKPGLYNITIDTNPIAGRVFHEGDPAYIVIYASKFGYESIWSDIIDVQPQPRPSLIDVPTEFQNIVLYPDWQYPTIEHPTILRVVLRDALNGEDLAHGTVKARINGGENTTLTLATPGLGLYEITSLSTEGLAPGSYNVTIYAEARDFVYSTTTVSLIIAPKQTITYDVFPFFAETVPNLGTEWSIRIDFYLENTSSLLVSFSEPWNLQMMKQPGSLPLPDGTKITLTITVEGSSSSITRYLVGGSVHFEGVLAEEGQHSFYITIDPSENYAGLSQEPLEHNGHSMQISVESLGTVFLRNLPMILLLAVVVILLPLSGFMTYRRYVLLPRRRQRLAKYQAIADTFSDVANLNRLLVLHKDSGICVFDPFAEESQDATLVAGFLQAISTFGHDLGDSPGLANDTENARALRELQYEGFRILINDGEFVRVALVLSGTPSDQLRNRLETFSDAFESRYKADFRKWNGRVDQFNSASDLVEEVFLISLRHPHSVAPDKPRDIQLSTIESDIYKLSKELTKDRQYVFLGQILSTYLAAAKTDKLEALMAIYQLRMKDMLLPLQIGPLPPSKASAA